MRLKIDADAIFNNWTQRQKTQFHCAPIGPSTEEAISELMTYHKSLTTEKILLINFETEFYMQQDVELITHHRKNIIELLPHTEIANFEQEFAPIFYSKQIGKKQAELRLKISSKGLKLYPEYEYKLDNLKRLNDIDDQNTVTLKGRVACKMWNELMITELVLLNIFNDLVPAEIAALLSSLVFQGKTQMEPIFPDNLNAICTFFLIEIKYWRINSILQCIETIRAVDRDLCAVEDDVLKEKEEDNRLNFGLVHVVYEWAKNMVNKFLFPFNRKNILIFYWKWILTFLQPFAEIMKPTDIQEGVIVFFSSYTANWKSI